MLNKLAKRLADLIYGTNRIQRKYEHDYPNEPVFAADASKCIASTSNQEIQRGLDWVSSQRAVILLTDQKIICGNWIIPLDTISSAQLVKLNSLFVSGYVLKIKTTDNRNYQFGMQLNPAWINQTALPLTLEEGQIKYSAVSIILRLILIGCIIYLIFDWFGMRI